MKRLLPLLILALLIPSPALAWETPAAVTRAMAVFDEPVRQCRKDCRVTEAGLTFTKLFEGYRAYPYRDSAGHWTIGFGHLILLGETFQTPLQGEAAHALLVKDMGLHSAEVNRAVNVPLWPGQFDALSDFAFNKGVGALRTSTLLKLVNKALHEAAADQFPRWIYARDAKTKKPVILPGLKRRAFAQAEMYRRAKP